MNGHSNPPGFVSRALTSRYANRAKKIKTNVKRNVLKVNYHISQYENLIRGLREEIATLKGKLARNGNAIPSLGPLFTARH